MTTVRPTDFDESTVAVDHTSPPSPWRRMRVWATAHAVDDFYQGLVPAAIPYFVLDRDYSYLQASGLALAATLGSSLPQPLLGIYADRRRARCLAPLGLAVAGIGAGAAGLASQYVAVWVLLLLSGLGVAAFHPAAGRDARRAAGDSATAMSIFAAGGSVGFFIAPAVATPALSHLGVGATALFIPPAALMAYVLLRHQRRTHNAASTTTTVSGSDRWVQFCILTCIEIVRSIMFFGMNTFIALYWIRHLASSAEVGGLALTGYLAGGVLGTILGGRLGDRYSLVRTIQIGTLAAIPSYVLLRYTPNSGAALALAVLAGIVTNIPFAVLIKLGQDYLPSRPGTAAGVTLGLAVSAGGLFVPLLGLIADHHGPEGVLTTLCFVPLIAIALGLLLRNPLHDTIIESEQESP